MGKEIAQVKMFLEEVQKDFRIKRAILFGSRARGDYLKHSDIDLILGSDDFEGVSFPDHPSEMYPYWKGGFPLEVLYYTVKEFEKKKEMIGLVHDALKEGILLI